jgi:hypothetical protein
MRRIDRGTNVRAIGGPEELDAVQALVEEGDDA